VCIVVPAASVLLMLVAVWLQNNTTDRWASAARISVWISVTVSLILAVAGYLQFRGITQGNVLNNYAIDDELVNFTRIVYAVTMILTYPMEIFVARHCVFALARLAAAKRRGALSSWSVTGDTPASNGAPPNLPSHFIVSLLMFGLSLTIAMITSDLGIVLEITGSVSATVLGFIMPAGGVCVLRLFTAVCGYHLCFPCCHQRCFSKSRGHPSSFGWMLMAG
jgi:solute carrier family 38 (sodium-coupled neutral amino acid transporter), member 11